MAETDRRVDCAVTIPPELQLGAFANAFRIIQDTGQDFYLDFLVFSETEKKAVLVARIRVHATFLPAVRERLNATLIEIQVAGANTPLTVVSPLEQN